MQGAGSGQVDEHFVEGLCHLLGFAFEVEGSVGGDEAEAFAELQVRIFGQL